MSAILKFGTRLRAARKAAGYRTSKEFLRKFNIPASTFSQHESGIRSPNEEMLEFYSRTFGVNLEWLRTGKGMPYSKANNEKIKTLNEESIDLDKLKNKKDNLNQKLFTKILTEMFKLNEINFSEKFIRSIVHQSISVYYKIQSLQASEKLQEKLIRKLLSELI